MANGREDRDRLLAELEAVAEIGKVLTSTLEVAEVLTRIMERVSSLLKPRRWSMLLAEPETGRLRFHTAVGEEAEGLQEKVIEPGEGIAGWVAQHDEAVLLTDVREDRRWTGRFDVETGFETRSVLAVPMSIRERVLGVIELVGGPEDPAFDERDLRILSSIGDYAAISIENARNYDRVQALSIIDEHTGLFNARYLFQTLRQEVERARRYLHPVSLVFLDLDRFKQVNDTYGHLAGSGLLSEVGEVVRGACRAIDIACRYGGDEFVIVLPETGRDGARRVARRVRDSMREHDFLQSRGYAIRITASVGVATYPDDAKTSDELLSAADRAMYAAKDAGRDTVQAAAGLDPATAVDDADADAEPDG